MMSNHVVIKTLDELLSMLRMKHVARPSKLSVHIFDTNAPSELRRIDSRIKLTVIGFVKRVQQILPTAKIIPTTIVYICVQYYGFDECFEVAGSPVAISG
eukprot:317993_1